MTTLLFDSPASAGNQVGSTVDCIAQMQDGLVVHLHRTRGHAESEISYRRDPSAWKLLPRRVRFPGGRAFLAMFAQGLQVDCWQPAHALDLPTISPAQVRAGSFGMDFSEIEFTPEMLTTRSQALRKVAKKNAKFLRRLGPGEAMRYHDGWWSCVEFGSEISGTFLSVDMSPCGVGRLSFDRTLACRLVRPTAAELRAIGGAR